MSNEALCHCGTVDEALEAAKKLIIQMTASDCPVWAFQVASAAAYLAARQLTEGEPELITGMLLAGKLVTEEAAKINIVALREESAAAGRKLYNN